MQLCPELMRRLLAQVRAAASTSASASTRYASLPPSSRTLFLTRLPAFAATALPAATLPVRVTAAICGSSRIPATRSLPTSKVAKSPFGSPASRSTLSMASAQPGTLPACLSTTAFPAISAGAAARKTCQNGKFHGITASTTPSGW